MRKATHYLGLDLLRILAATLVLLDHFGAFSWQTATVTTQPGALAFPSLSGMESVGSIGVEIFFLISGFVIAASAKGSTATQFALNRAIRVLPALWICGLIAFAARASTGEPLGQLAVAFAKSAVLSPAGPYIDGVVWTLVVEAVFYALIFGVLLTGSFGRLGAVAVGLGGISALFLSWLAILTLMAPHNPQAAALATICGRFPFKVFLLRHGVFFALGMLLWLSFTQGFERGRLRWMAIFAFFCSVEILVERGTFADGALPLAIWWAGFGAIVFSVLKADLVSHWLQRGHRTIQNLGRLSYPLYLNHYVLGMVLVPALFRQGLPRGAVLAVALAIVVGSSFFIMLGPERMAQRILRAKMRRWLARPAESHPDRQARPVTV